MSRRAGCDGGAGGAPYLKPQGAEREREAWVPWLCRGGGAGAAGSQETLDSLAVKLHPSTAIPWCEEEVGVQGVRHSGGLTAGCECCLWKGGAGGRRGLQPAIGAAVKKQTEQNKKTTPTLGGSLPAPAGFIRTFQPKNTQILSQKKSNLSAPNLSPTALHKAGRNSCWVCQSEMRTDYPGCRTTVQQVSLGGCPVLCL